MHGYELRKRLNSELGAFRAFSYGSLYPCLKEMLRLDLVSGSPQEGAAGWRSRIVYQLTSEGRERLRALLSESTPAATDDECFGVHFTLFGRTRTEVRMRILRGRRHRLLERLDFLRERVARATERGDPYIYELHRHRVESVEREVDWLEDLIKQERRRAENAGVADANISGSAPPLRGDPSATDQQM